MARGVGLYEQETVVTSAARTTSSDSGALYGYGPANTLIVAMPITAVSGTTPTINFTIEDSLDGTNWNTIGTGTSNRNATGNDVVRITQPFADTIRIRWVIAGTTPSFTFAVHLFSQAPGV